MRWPVAGEYRCPEFSEGAIECQAGGCGGPVFSPLPRVATMSSVHDACLSRAGFVGRVDAPRLGLEPVLRLQSGHAPANHMHGLATSASPGRPCWRRHVLGASARRAGAAPAAVGLLRRCWGAGSRSCANGASPWAAHAAAPATGSRRRAACARPSCRSLASRYWKVKLPLSSQRRMSRSWITPRCEVAAQVQ